MTALARVHAHMQNDIYISEQINTHTHSERSDGQVPQTAFPSVIRLSEPSPLSNLSPVALLGLNTQPASYTTPPSVSVCESDCVQVCIHKSRQCVCVKFLFHIYLHLVYVCLIVCVCCLQPLKLCGLVTGPHQSMTRLLSLEPSGFMAEHACVCVCVSLCVYPCFMCECT